MKSASFLATGCCLLVVAGCSTQAPDYQRPSAPIPQEFRQLPAHGQGSLEVLDRDWHQVFVDPRLQKVISMALAGNQDLRIALLNIEKARAQYRIRHAELFPSIGASAGRTASRASVADSDVDNSRVRHTFSAEVGFTNWELDLFGRLRDLKREALHNYLATGQAQRNTRLTLVAETATDWLNLGAYQRRLALAQDTLHNQQETLRLSQRMHEQGIISGVDLSQVQASVESARADVAAYQTELEQARNALELVVGQRVPDALLPQPAGQRQPVALAALPAGLNSSVLLRRPDVLAAEYALKAANADIGAARAAFFPSITLTASAGRGSTELSDLFNSNGRTWSFIPNISLPIFTAGELRASLDVAKIEKDISVARYRHAIQSAFSEVSDALAARANIDRQLNAQNALVDATRHSYQLADARFRNGVDSYLAALDSQRALYGAQQGLISLDLLEAANRVTLYKVFGGGADAQATALDAQTTTPVAPWSAKTPHNKKS